jgi:hypothetical protein
VKNYKKLPTGEWLFGKAPKFKKKIKRDGFIRIVDEQRANDLLINKDGSFSTNLIMTDKELDAFVKSYQKRKSALKSGFFMHLTREVSILVSNETRRSTKKRSVRN